MFSSLKSFWENWSQGKDALPKDTEPAGYNKWTKQKDKAFQVSPSNIEVQPNIVVHRVTPGNKSSAKPLNNSKQDLRPELCETETHVFADAIPSWKASRSQESTPRHHNNKGHNLERRTECNQGENTAKRGENDDATTISLSVSQTRSKQSFERSQNESTGNHRSLQGSMASKQHSNITGRLPSSILNIAHLSGSLTDVKENTLNATKTHEVDINKLHCSNMHQLTDPGTGSYQRGLTHYTSSRDNMGEIASPVDQTCRTEHRNGRDSRNNKADGDDKRSDKDSQYGTVSQGGTCSQCGELPTKNATARSAYEIDESVNQFVKDGNKDVFIKYASEPSKLSTLHPQTRARAKTQESVNNFINCKIKSVSISSDDSGILGLSASRTSFPEEFREFIADKTKTRIQSVCENQDIVETRSFKKGKKVLQETGLLIIVSDEGSGATTLGLGVLSQAGQRDVYIVSDSDEFRMCTSSKDAKSTCIFVDDPFGFSEVNELEKEKWFKQFEDVRQSKDHNTRLIVTVKHHIASQILSGLSRFQKYIVDLEEPVLSLTPDESLEIMEAMVRNHSLECKVVLKAEDIPSGKRHLKYTVLSQELLEAISENVISSGFPKLFKTFLDKSNVRKGFDFFACPRLVLDKIRTLKESEAEEDNAKYLALVALSLFKGRLDSKCIEEINTPNQDAEVTLKKKSKRQKKKSKHVDTKREVPMNIKMMTHYARKLNMRVTECVERGLNLLNGVLVIKERSSFFRFKANCIKNAMLVLLGNDFPHFVLKICDSDFFKTFLCSKGCFETSKPCVKIDTEDALICDDAMKLIFELLEEGDTEMIAQNSLMSDQQIINHLLCCLENTDKLWKLCTTNDRTTGQPFLRSILVSHGNSVSFRSKGNFVFQLLQHRAWKQIRTKKNYKQRAAEIEKEVLMHCCLTGNHDQYFFLKETFDLKVDRLCLKSAVKKGCAPIVNDILKKIGNDMTQEENVDLLQYALLRYSKEPNYGRRSIVDMFLEHVPIDFKARDKEPFIHYATKYSDGKMIMALKLFDGDINLTDSEGQTCLHLASKLNKAGFLKMALENGADQRKRDRGGRLPIHLAVEQNNSFITQLLCDQDSDIIFETDQQGLLPLHLAAKYNSVEAARVLMERMEDVDPLDNDQNTPLHYAVESGKGTVVHFLLQKRANCNFRNKDGKLPLYVACKSENMQAVRRILKHKASNCDHSDPDPLFAAVEQRHTKMLKLLLHYGFDVNARDSGGNTLLQAAIRTDTEYVNALLKERVDVNMPGKHDYPIHTAVRTDNKDILELLIKAKANLTNVTQDTHDTVLHIATEYGYEKLVYFILAQKECEQLISCRNKRGEVPLHVAARNGNLKLCRTLLAHGSERSPINKSGVVPLTIAEFKCKGMENMKDSPRYQRRYEELFSVVMLLRTSGNGYVMETAV